MGTTADLILKNAKIHTLDPQNPRAEAIAIGDERILSVGSEADAMRFQGPNTRVIDGSGRTVVPGLNDSHIHLIRGGLNYNMELRWDGVDSLADALAMLREQALRTPAPQWVRVVGGWSEYQFKERRMPTLDEINAVSGDVPVFILHLYDRALLNRAALRAVGYDQEVPPFPGCEVPRDAKGQPTGMLIAKPNATILYATLAKGPKLEVEDQINSTRHFMRELNRLGITSVIDAGGGFQNYPDDYHVIDQLHARQELTVRVAYNLFTQRPKQEKEDFANWVRLVKPGDGSRYYRHNGAGEMLVFSAADFEDFLEPRPDLAPQMESELEEVIRILVGNRWPFRLHATYDESIQRFLDVFEKVNRDIPFDGLRWFFDHAETVQPASLERIRALGGGLAVQHRMAYQGEYFVDRYGAESARQTPPVRRMLQEGIPVGAGTDATRVASYNPWVALSWLSSGKTVGGLPLYGDENLLDREEALRLYTSGSAWFSGEEAEKGILREGLLGDLILLAADYFSVPDEEVRRLTSDLTVVGGKVVHGAGDYANLAPPLPPISPDWSPVRRFGGYAGAMPPAETVMHACAHAHGPARVSGKPLGFDVWGAGCACWSF